nr:ATP-binding protein [Maridesulfovibrio zosterae]
MIDSMPSTLIGVDPEGIITQWNKRAEDLTGLTAEQALGTPLVQAMPGLDKEIDHIKQAISSCKKQTYGTVSNVDESTQIYEDITIYPLISDKARGAVIRIDDVTERVNMERMMLQSEKMLSIGGLAAGMAHEINNPLAGILGHAINIKKRIYSDIPSNISVAQTCNASLQDVREYLDKREIPRMLDGITDAGERAANIVSNMLSFARKSDNNFTPQNLGTLIDKTLELAINDYNLKKSYDFRRIKIIREYALQTPLVRCSGNEIQQVLLNLFKNGAEAMAEKNYVDSTPHFICRVYVDNSMAVIEIEDNGGGMTDIIRNRIFEPFYTTKEIGQGTGLGLSVSYFIIANQHNGTMAVESNPGHWTRFTIKIPLKQPI